MEQASASTANGGLVVPRIAPVSLEGNPPDIQAQIDDAAEATGGAANIFLTLARYPGLLRKYLPFAGKLLNAGRIEPRLRELTILRTAWLCRSEYEWAQHNRIGRDAGLTDAEILRVVNDPDDAAWSHEERTVLLATDEMVATRDFSDATWAAIGEFFDEQQRMEFSMLVGAYVMLAGFLNATRVEIEPGSARFPN
jgi:alkylhydroperoxidase family enzyme